MAGRRRPSLPEADRNGVSPEAVVNLPAIVSRNSLYVTLTLASSPVSSAPNVKASPSSIPFAVADIQLDPDSAQNEHCMISRAGGRSQHFVGLRRASNNNARAAVETHTIRAGSGLFAQPHVLSPGVAQEGMSMDGVVPTARATASVFGRPVCRPPRLSDGAATSPAPAVPIRLSCPSSSNSEPCADAPPPSHLPLVASCSISVFCCCHPPPPLHPVFWLCSLCA